MSITARTSSHLSLVTSVTASRRDALFPDLETGVDTERLQWVVLASQVAQHLSTSGLLVPENLEDFELDERPAVPETIEYTLDSLKIKDLPGGAGAIYTTLLVNGRTFLGRDGRFFCHAAEETELMLAGAIPAATEDYQALQQGLPLLVEIAKFPVADQPTIEMDSTVRRSLSACLSGAGQLFKSVLADYGNAVVAFNALVIHQTLEQMRRAFQTILSAVNVAARAAQRLQPQLGVIAPTGASITSLRLPSL